MWAGGILAALGTMALLVDKRYPGAWEDLSRARIEQVAWLVAIGVPLTVIIVLRNGILCHRTRIRDGA